MRRMRIELPRIDLDLQGLDLLSDVERKASALHVQMMINYARGKTSADKLRNLTAAAAVIAKRQQSRSAMALLSWNMSARGDTLPPGEVRTKKIIATQAA